jgi:hypothetical protein
MILFFIYILNVKNDILLKIYLIYKYKMKLYRFDAFLNEDTWDGDSDVVTNISDDIKNNKIKWEKDLLLINELKPKVVEAIKNVKIEDISFDKNSDYPQHFYIVNLGYNVNNLLIEYITLYNNLISNWKSNYVYMKKFSMLMFDDNLISKNRLNTDILIYINNNKYNKLDFTMDINYIYKFIQGLGLGLKIILKVIEIYKYITIDKDPDNHDSLSIINKLFTHDKLYTCIINDIIICIDKNYENINLLLDNVILKNTKLNNNIQIDPQLNYEIKS